MTPLTSRTMSSCQSVMLREWSHSALTQECVDTIGVRDTRKILCEFVELAAPVRAERADHVAFWTGPVVR